MLDRRIAADEPVGLLRERFSSYPAVALVGPRQCGKTTLARSFGGRYYDMEQETDQLRLDLEWAEATASEGLVVIDEAQTAPEIFPRLRGAIDTDRRRNGRFLLLGSISPALMRNVSESLAGRLSVVELTPLSWLELSENARERLWRCGGYPDGGVLDGRAFPDWQHDYLDLLAQRDLPSWGLPATAQTTRRLFGLLAARPRPAVERQRCGQRPGPLLSHRQLLPRLPRRSVPDPTPARLPRQRRGNSSPNDPRYTGATAACCTSCWGLMLTAIRRHCPPLERAGKDTSSNKRSPLCSSRGDDSTPGICAPPTAVKSTSS